MRKVLVIGAGIFGVHIAIQLAEDGFDVTLVEQSETMLSGTSGNSILRVHSGLHYPRDLDTAIQSQQGYSPFSLHYRDCIRSNFENFYALSRLNSKSSKKEVQDLAQKASIEIHEINPAELIKFGMNIDLLDSAWSVDEGVVDLLKLREFTMERIKELDLNVVLNYQIRELNYSNGLWIAESEHFNLSSFNYVIRATHGRDSIDSNLFEVPNQNYEFHLTSMIEIASKSVQFGMTVLDGDFISLLPAGFNEHFLLYGPGVSVLEKFTGINPPPYWKELPDIREQETINRSLQLLAFWFPDFAATSFVRMRNTVRAVQSNVSSSDRRVTQVVQVATNFFDIKSTKIDHVIEAGDYLSRTLVR